MDDQSRVVISTLAGAVFGGVLGYLYLTEDGRRLREQIEPKIDDFVAEVRRVRSTVEKAQSAAHESLRSIHELIGEDPEGAFERGARQPSH